MASADRELLRRFLAAIAYRAQKSLRHMTSVLGYARTFFIGGSYPVHPEPLATFAGEIERFHSMVAELGTHLEAVAGSTGCGVARTPAVTGCGARLHCTVAAGRIRLSLVPVRSSFSRPPRTRA